MTKFTLRQAREMVGLTLMELQAQSGVPYSSIASIEVGRVVKPGYEIVMLLVNALRRAGLKNLKPEDIFDVPDLPALKAADSGVEGTDGAEVAGAPLVGDLQEPTHVGRQS